MRCKWLELSNQYSYNNLFYIYGHEYNSYTSNQICIQTYADSRAYFNTPSEIPICLNNSMTIRDVLFLYRNLFQSPRLLPMKYSSETYKSYIRSSPEISRIIMAILSLRQIAVTNPNIDAAIASMLFGQDTTQNSGIWNDKLLIC